MDKVKEHFEAEAKEFDDIIKKLIPFYEQMVDSLVRSMKRKNSIKRFTMY